MSNNEIPFKTNERGQYRVTEPIGSVIADEITINVNGTEYQFTGYAGKAVHSRVGPDVLLYNYCDIVSEDEE